METCKIGSLNVADFEDDQDAEFLDSFHDLGDASLEDVVETYYRRECKRGRGEDNEARAAVRVDADLWPQSIKGSLEVFADATPARSVATLTKCAAYPITWWYMVVLGMDELLFDYKEADRCVRSIKDPFLQSTLLGQLESAPFRLPELEERRMRVEVPGWFRTRSSRYADKLGTPMTQLIAAGLEWFLTRTSRPELDEANITYRYKRDAQLLEIYVAERRMDFVSIKQKAELRKRLRTPFTMGGDVGNSPHRGGMGGQAP